MLNISGIKVGKYIILNGEPYQVLYREHSKMGRAGAVLRTKIKNFLTGNVLEHTFKGSEKVEEADVSRSSAQYLYAQNDQYFFMDNTSYDQFSLPAAVVPSAESYLKNDLEVEVVNFNGQPITIELPIKMEFEVIEAPPGVKGDTVSGGAKLVTIETGAKINVPLFVKTGDRIIVNTQKDEYVSRA